MSASPIIGTVVGALMAALLAVVSTIAGLDNPGAGTSTETGEFGRSLQLPRVIRHVNVLPIACVVFGVILGAVLGVFGRTHEWLAPDPQKFIGKWTSLGMPRDQALQLLIQTTYGVDETAVARKPEERMKGGDEPLASGSSTANLAPVLFSTSASKECEVYKNSYGHGDELVRALAASSDQRVRTLIKDLGETSKGQRAIEIVTRDLLCTPAASGTNH